MLMIMTVITDIRTVTTMTNRQRVEAHLPICPHLHAGWKWERGRKIKLLLSFFFQTTYRNTHLSNTHWWAKTLKILTCHISLQVNVQLGNLGSWHWVQSGCDCSGVYVGGTVESNIHLNARTQGFPAEHCVITRGSMLVTCYNPPASGFMLWLIAV